MTIYTFIPLSHVLLFDPHDVLPRLSHAGLASKDGGGLAQDRPADALKKNVCSSKKTLFGDSTYKLLIAGGGNALKAKSIRNILNTRYVVHARTK